jgi:hypothetical protein
MIMMTLHTCRNLELREMLNYLLISVNDLRRVRGQCIYMFSREEKGPRRVSHYLDKGGQNNLIRVVLERTEFSNLGCS